MEAPSSSPPHSRLSLAVIILLQEKSQTIKSLPFNAAAVSLGWDLFALLSDLAAHSSVSSAPQAPLAVPHRALSPSLVVWTLLLPWGCAWAALDRALLPLDHGGFCFPPLAISVVRSSLSCLLGRGLAAGCLCPSQSPRYFHSFLALAIRKKEALVLVQRLSCPGSLMTNKRTRFSLEEFYNHLFADTTFLVMKGGQREESFSPVPLGQSKTTVWNSGHS